MKCSNFYQFAGSLIQIVILVLLSFDLCCRLYKSIRNNYLPLPAANQHHRLVNLLLADMDRARTAVFPIAVHAEYRIRPNHEPESNTRQLADQH